MNNEEFVEVVKKVIVNGSIKAVKSVLKSPPGRQPLPEVIAMSKWYNELNENDRCVVEQIIKKSVDMAVFSFSVCWTVFRRLKMRIRVT